MQLTLQAKSSVSAPAFVGGVVLGAAVVGAAIGIVRLEDPAPFLIALASIATIAPFLFAREKVRYAGLTDPAAAFAFTIAVVVVLRAAAVYIASAYGWRGFDTRAGLNPMLALATASLVAWDIGYLFAIARWRRADSPMAHSYSPTRDTVLWVFALLALAWIGTLLYLFQSHLGPEYFVTGRSTYDTTYRSSVAYLYGAHALALPSLLIAMLLWKRGLRWPFILALAIAAPLLVAEIAKGNRLFLFSVGFSLLSYHYLTTRRLPSPAILLVALIPLLLVASVLGQTRNVATPQSFSSVLAATATAPGDGLSTLLLGADSEAGQGLMLLVEIMPASMQFQPGSLVTSVVAAPIPRAIWAGKPVIPEERITATLFPDDYARSRAGATYTAMGSLFFDSGWLGAIAGMGLSGLAFGWLWARLTRLRTLGGLACAATLPAFAVAFARASWPPALEMALWTLIPMLLILRPWRLKEAPIELATFGD